MWTVLRCIVFACLCPGVAYAAPIQWTTAAGGNGHYYDFIPTQISWTDAEAAVSALSFDGLPGYLATITTAAENNFITANFNQLGWLGGSDAAVEGDWRWVGGPEAGQLFFVGQYPDPNRQTIIYSDWGSNEPNNFDNTPYGFPYPGEDYLEFDPRPGGKWNDAPAPRFFRADITLSIHRSLNRRVSCLWRQD